MLINLNEAKVKFVLYAVRELAAKLEGKLSTDKPVLTVAPNQVRLTKAGRPAKKPGRKPGKRPVVKQPEQQAA
jgi:hypothetical protein